VGACDSGNDDKILMNNNICDQIGVCQQTSGCLIFKHVVECSVISRGGVR
jgi:hypothetical protein